MERRNLLRRFAAGGTAVVGLGWAATNAADGADATASDGIRTDADAGTETGTATATETPTETSGTIGQLYFDSTSSLLTPEFEAVASDDHVAVRAADTAEVTDEDGNGDAVIYEEPAPALVGVADTVVGFGTMLVTDDTDFAYGNDEFVLNVWDQTAGSGRIVWDDGHDQYYTSDRFARFAAYADENGYTVEGSDSVTDELSDAAGVVITSPSTAFSEAELDALASFADDGGAVFLHDQSDFENFDETDNLNEIASALELPFRFNDDQVIDNETNAGAFYQPATAQFNTAFDFFDAREGIASGPEFQFDREYTATVTAVDDGDTFGVEFDDGSTEEVRVLGIDTPEVPAAADAENPHEWEGLGDQSSMPERDGEYPYLSSWGTEVSTFAEAELTDATVTLTFDRNEGIEDPFG
ncbi:MAG: thermonuclease family protein, partial [Halobaculum sp.]